VTGADVVLEALEREGVELIFGYPGGANLPIYQHLPEHPRLKHILVRHEQGAAHMADGYARACGKPGVVFATSGPGALNLVTGLATANSEGDPVVAIGGAVATADRLKQIHQSMDTVNLFRPITKFSAEIDSPDSVSEVIANAFRAAESGRPGAAFVSAPKDIITGIAEGDVLTPAAPGILGPADAHAIQDLGALDV